MTLATATYLGLIYQSLPAGLPVRYMRGEPIYFQLKTPIVVMLPALVQAALLLTFSALGLLMLWRVRPGGRDAGDPADWHRMRTAVEVVAVLGSLWITVQAIGAARLVALWQGGRGGFGRIYNVTVLVSLVISGIVVWRTTSALDREKSPATEINPAMWRLTHLYFNPQNPALFVPSRRGAGWTLNFGRPLAIVLIAAVLTAGIGGPFLLARTVLWEGAFAMLMAPR
jgi:uncharacterized membrane protein